jgi:ABC-type transport system involved in cytochrome c biogenesis permease subunit
MEVFNRFVAFNELMEQNVHVVPPLQPHNPEWQPILGTEGHTTPQQSELSALWKQLLDALRSKTHADAETTAVLLAERLARVHPALYPAPWRITWEIAYNDYQPFRCAQVGYALAFVLMLLGSVFGPQRRWVGSLVAVGAALLGAAFVVHALGIVSRVVLGGRPPVSNFFETLLWIPWVLVLVALVFERVYKVHYFTLTAGLIAAVLLFIAEIVPLDASITPVVAVLRSNKWLTIHVLTIVSSYSVLTLATGLAHVYGVFYLTRKPAALLEQVSLWLYRLIQIGVVLLAAGIMLGAVWANASWGRYWAWDPKETWALITLLWFIAVLHGRFAGWLKGLGVSISTVAGFFLLLITYYGVSFYLVGLHSYAGGNAKPVPGLLLIYTFVELFFVIGLGWAYLLRKRLPH